MIEKKRKENHYGRTVEEEIEYQKYNSDRRNTNMIYGTPGNGIGFCVRREEIVKLAKERKVILIDPENDKKRMDGNI